jgi:hypothetical protein
MESIYNYAEIVKALSEGPCNVHFTKVNGEFRDMLCTLNADLMGLEGEQTASTTIKVNEAVVRCYDLNAKGWRAFRLDSVLNFSPVV